MNLTATSYRNLTKQALPASVPLNLSRQAIARAGITEAWKLPEKVHRAAADRDAIADNLDPMIDMIIVDELIALAEAIGAMEQPAPAYRIVDTSGFGPGPDGEAVYRAVRTPGASRDAALSLVKKLVLDRARDLRVQAEEAAGRRRLDPYNGIDVNTRRTALDA